MKTFAEEVEALRAQAVTIGAEIETLKAAVETHKQEATVAVAALAERELAHTATVDAIKDELSEVVNSRNDVAAQAVEHIAKVAQLEGKLALVPAMADVSAGAQAVADGGSVTDAKDWITEVEGRTGADRMAFYGANKVAIDAAYVARNRK